MTDYTTTLFDSDFEENEYMKEQEQKKEHLLHPHKMPTYDIRVSPELCRLWHPVTPFSPALGQRVLLTVGGTAREGYRVTEGQFRTMDGSTHTGVTHWSEMPAGYSPAEEVRHE